ncbi:MAG: hypothetical protein U0228_05200 [Myxococcaceae bacterium]
MSLSPLLAVVASLLGQAAPARHSPEQAWLEGARAQLGVPYTFGGRRRRGDGIDCLGVVLAGAERATGCGWRSFPVDPTALVNAKVLGVPVEGLAPIKSSALDLTQLRPGDVIMLVAPDENPKEGPIGTLDGRPVWVWHMGLYAGDGRWIVGDHFAGQVVEVPLAPYLAEHADTYTGVFITRPPGPLPQPCRKHAPLK